MNLREYMRGWFDTHSPQSNFALFKKIKNDKLLMRELNNYTVFLDESASLQQRLYHYYYEIASIPTCRICGAQLKFCMFSVPYPEFCSKSCIAKSMHIEGRIDYEKTRNTYLENHKPGSEEAAQVAEKKKKTLLDRYGVDHPMKIEEAKKKYRENSMEKYGTDWVSKSDIVKKKISETWKNHPDKAAIDKKRDENYKAAMQEKYGVDTAYSLDSTHKKRIVTLNLHYNVDVPLQNKEIQRRLRTTCQERYGYPNAMQNLDVQRRVFLNTIKLKDYVLPSGNIIKYQGYLNFALDMLLLTHEEAELLIEFDCPNIHYEYNGTSHYYRPDLFIPGKNLIIEVKSDYTYNKTLIRNELKAKFCVAQGYKYEFWVFDKYGALNIIEYV